MVVGWAMAPRMTADIVVSALEMAHGRGYVADGSIFHSDYAAESAKPQILTMPLAEAQMVPVFAA
jgi:hypothetical protein